MAAVQRLLLQAEEMGKEAGMQGFSSVHTACLAPPLHPADVSSPHSPGSSVPGRGKGLSAQDTGSSLEPEQPGSTLDSPVQTWAPRCAL